MKISKIKLSNHLHFKKKLVLDLRYPKGHPKEGKPLDKICFLGQSGTGKTTLLNLVKYFTCENGSYDKKSIDTTKIKENGIEITYRVGTTHFTKISTDVPFKFMGYDYSNVNRKTITDFDLFLKKEIEPKIKNRSHVLLNFPFCVVGPQDISDSSKEGLGQKKSVKFDTPKKTLKYDPETGELNTGEAEKTDELILSNINVWDFSHENIRWIWKIVFSNISDYITKYKDQQIKLAQDVIKVAEGDREKLIIKFKEWEKKNLNPIQDLAEKCLNPVLEKFNLEVETEINKYPLEISGESYLIIKGKNNGEEIKYPFLSTGTKQVMLTSIPLVFLRPSNTIILFDQPETSLYPDIQKLIPSIYIEAAPDNNQFFFATHSPVVAATFEPWEVIELKFDEKLGTVYQEKYYEGDRHVNNYLKDPRYLRWDTLYMKFFGLKEEGNEAFRDKELMKAKRLQMQLNKLKEDGKEKTKDFKNKQKEYIISAKRLGWDL